MELNRNHFFVLGMVLLLLGIQFRYVESFVLNEKSSRFVAKKLKWDQEQSLSPRTFTSLLSVMPPPESRRTIVPPRWLGWSFISVGVVLMLHSLSMRRPD